MTQRLVSCRGGDRVVVSAIEGSPSRIDRLASIGIVPGIELVVQQTRPVVVVECDESVLALEREIAAGIVVAKAAPAVATELAAAEPAVARLAAAEPAAASRAKLRVAALAFALSVAFALGVSGCMSEAPRRNAAGSLPPIAEVHAEKCGACHSLPAPRTRSRGQLEQAFSRHHRRVHLAAEEWAAMVDYLAAPGAAVAVQTAR